jgi:hypothetical protein
MKIADNLSVLAYRDGSEHGVLRTIKTSDNGTSINASLTNGTLEFDSINCFEPDLICVADNIYAITYRGSNDNGYLKTVRIADNGTVYPQVIDTFIFDLLNETYESQIIHVANNTYAIAYRDYNKNGLLATVEINENGTIIKQVIDILEFEENYCLLPDITHMRNEIYLIAYEYEQLDGYVASIIIKPNGSISFESKFQFNTKKNYHGLEPDIFRVSDDIYAIAFRSGSQSGTPHEGHLISCRFSYYDVPVDPLGIRVIYREGVYGIYVNQTHISATIGNHVISKEMVLSPTDWNQIVLTYNNSIIKLYINGNEETSEFYNGGIASSIKDIYFGRSFYGHIDEIAIYGRELLPDEILYHYNNPGKLESSIP